jgi:tetratricopeptide (TPR) repeat protein
MMIVGAFWLVLPGVSRLYNQLGRRDFKAGRIEAAEANFNKAIALNKNNSIAYYNLGYLYENLQDLSNAKAQYEIASEQDLPEANNNLARIYIIENQTSKAIALLREGLAELDASEDSDDDDLRYNLLKNLGWARQKQGITADADQYLSAAQTLAESSPQVIPNRASTYCLQAQNLEIQGKTDQALAKWEACCQMGSIDNPDEDAWIVTATKSLSAAGKTCNKDTSYPPKAANANP